MGVDSGGRGVGLGFMHRIHICVVYHHKHYIPPYHYVYYSFHISGLLIECFTNNNNRNKLFIEF